MAEIIFFNIWQADSRESQEALVKGMRSEAATLAAKPGFLSLTVWSGQEDNHRVLVEGRWASRSQFDAAIGATQDAAITRDRLVDTLMLARRKSPGGANRLDDLCVRFGIDNSRRTKHGALLDAELLAEVYIELVEARQAVTLRPE